MGTPGTSLVFAGNSSDMDYSIDPIQVLDLAATISIRAMNVPMMRKMQCDKQHIRADLFKHCVHHVSLQRRTAGGQRRILPVLRGGRRYVLALPKQLRNVNMHA